MSDVIETDYLVVGAGAAGMAFTDSLLTHSDATVTIVDRRQAPGGHWIDAYPFVRLHQPSAFYGVASVPLGNDAVDRSGLNAGFYELANADELRAYYAQVMQQHFIPSGRVRYFPGSDYVAGPAGGHRFTSRLTGATHEVRVRRKLVDATYLEGSIPATSAPPFEVADGVRCVAAGDITRLTHRPERFVVIGAGKTALDACVWLISQGVRPAAIRWIKPREGWWLNRSYHQPHTYLPDFYGGVGLQLQAMAHATSVDDVFARLESNGFFLRVDTAVTPTMCHGAIVSEVELGLLRQIEDVVRLGRVRRIERDRIVLDEGAVPTDENTVHVHCAARGLPHPPLRPIFESARVTVQPCFWGFACYLFALLGVVEATIERDEDKNRLCPPIAYWDKNADYLSAFLASLAGEQARAAYPALAAWAKSTRLNPLGAIGQYRDHPTVVETRERIKRFGSAAASNIVKLLSVSA
ncbi:NAD(P)-binding protein [Caenimonas soli]|uniref:NAD(P)-binding protein n=1 Tax=Caenimonas soli TaxID=2735555 RepID=UPI00155645BB|nr:NAD(P)-binding protein [Caenimonas soli]NPC59304.1 NAD(P)-binding protein [Caenimonas soli]